MVSILSDGDLNINFNDITTNDYWTSNDNDSLKMHKIHWYPAKFPPFLVERSLKYAQQQGIKIDRVVDFFCGCGTTPLECARLGYDFWGCDINPVATLIARVKSNKYDGDILNSYYTKIIYLYSNANIKVPKDVLDNDRLNYWYTKGKIIDLYKLLYSIKNTVNDEIYLDFFLCAFSNILRGCSRWLTKSIKPQIDLNKKTLPVLDSFNNQYKFMVSANNEINNIINNLPMISITDGSYFNINIKNEFANVVITSPPYVTSYEYADLHQLSTIWLGYVKDYRELRKGTVGSLYHTNIEIDYTKDFNWVGQEILSNINNKTIKRRNSRSIAKYFYDLKKTVQKTYNILEKDSIAFFIIGNTQYQGVYIDNAKYLAKCLLDEGFTNIEVSKREIGRKILTRFRDKKGRFTIDSKARKVYNVEYIIIAKK